jgi:hypothetical protein
MEATEFKTLREFLGLPISWLAHNTRVEEADIFAWEGGKRKIPNSAVELLTNISGILDEFEQNITNIYTHSNNVSNKPRTVVLLQYTCNEDLWRYQADFAPLPISTYNILLERVRNNLSRYGITMVTVFMLTDQYAIWLEKNQLSDDAAARGTWIAVQVSESDDNEIIEGDIVIAVY